MIAGKKSPEVLDYLLRRRSVVAADLCAPGPDADQLQSILKAAARVPDHGKMVPWYFVTFEGEDRSAMGDVLSRAYQKQNPEARTDKINVEKERFLRAPLVVGVVSRMRKGKNPVWEQVLSAGAVCQNLILAANASGFGAHWVTEWYAYDADVKAAMGLDARDHVAGFIYIGTPSAQPEERDRPDLDLIVSRYGDARQKGDVACDRAKFGFPIDGFDFTTFRDEG